MSKLERLNASVAQLLAVAVHEVLDVVGQAVTEYQEETARTRRENDSLRRRLRDLQEVLKKVEGGGQSPAEQQPGERDWSPRQAERGERDWSPRQGEPESPGKEQGVLLERGGEEHEGEDAAQGALSRRCLKSGRAPDHTPSPPALAPSPPGTSASHTVKTEVEPAECWGAEQTGRVPLYECGARQEAAGDPHPAALGPPYTHPDRGPARRFRFGKTIRSLPDGRKHKPYKRKEEQHICFLCGKTFSRVANLRIHQRCHTGEKPYCCLLCGRCFSQAGDLKKHKRVHTGEKPYHCARCGKSFSRGENLKRHQKTHLGDALLV